MAQAILSANDLWREQVTGKSRAEFVSISAGRHIVTAFGAMGDFRRSGGAMGRNCATDNYFHPI
jgi:hypothetical protein